MRYDCKCLHSVVECFVTQGPFRAVQLKDGVSESFCLFRVVKLYISYAITSQEKSWNCQEAMKCLTNCDMAQDRLHGTVITLYVWQIFLNLSCIHLKCDLLSCHHKLCIDERMNHETDLTSKYFKQLNNLSMKNLKSMDKMLPLEETSWILGGAKRISAFNVYLS